MSGDMHNENRCPFDIWAPDHRCSMNNKAFSAYAFHQQQIEEVISYLAAALDPDDPDTQERAFEEAGLNNYDLTEEDERYIINEIKRRR